MVLLIIIILILIIFIYVLFNINNNYKKIYTKDLFPNINNENIKNDNIIVYTLGTNMNKYMWNMISSLNQFDYSYKLLGLNEEWKGWNWRTNKYINNIKEHINNYGKDKIIVIIDCYDAMAKKPKDDLYENFINTGKKIIIGAEYAIYTGNKKSIVGNVDKWWKYNNLDSNKFKNKYLNAGFIMGYPEELLKIYEWIYNNKYQDDQIGMKDYVNNFPENIYLDINSEFVYNKLPFRIFEKKDSYFIHFPAYSTFMMFGFSYDNYYKMYLKNYF